MDRLDFHTRVLGKKASERLRHLDGMFLTFRSKLPEDNILSIYLDNKKLGVARNIARQKINLGSLTLSHATTGGFDTMDEQQRALKRAGYRFKPLNQYESYQIFFVGHWGK